MKGKKWIKAELGALLVVAVLLLFYPLSTTDLPSQIHLTCASYIAGTCPGIFNRMVRLNMGKGINIPLRSLNFYYLVQHTHHWEYLAM